MSILTLDNLAQSFGDFDLFRGISGTIPNDGKVGLVGPNGIGKTTLLLIIAGEMAPAAGKVYRSRGTRLGYLPQESARAFDGRDHTIYAELLTVFAALRAREANLRAVEQQIAAGDHSAELLAQYSQAAGSL
jgi:ATP-binding cassette subfamily F protein 3